MKKDIKIIIISVIFFAVMSSMFASMDRQVWFDEAFSVLYAKNDVGYIMEPHDVHPPFYYLVLHGWMQVAGMNSVALRGLSVVLGSIGVVYLFLLWRRLFPYTETLMWIFIYFMYVFSGTIIHYATEIRMYALGTLAAMMSFYYMFKMIDSKFEKNTYKYLFSAILMLGCHYYTVIYFGLQALYILFNIKKDYIKRLWIQITVVVMFMCVYVTYFMSQKMRVIGMWFDEISWVSMLSTYHYYFFYFPSEVPFVNSIIGLIFVLFFLFSCFWCIDKFKKSKAKELAFLAIIAIVPPLIGMVINVFIMNVYHHRLFLFGAWAAYILFGAAMYRYGKGSIVARRILLVVIILLFAFNTAIYKSNEEFELKYFWWALYMDSGCDSGQYVLHETMFTMESIEYYNQAYGCNLKNRIYVQFMDKAKNSAGWDALNRSQIDFYNDTGNEFDEFYYFNNSGMLKINRSCRTVLNDRLNIDYCGMV